MERRSLVNEVFRRDPRPRVKNSYRNQGKLPSGTRCPSCGAIYTRGRWTSSVKPLGNIRAIRKCPACLQQKDDFPGGVLRLSGTFLQANRREILKRVRNIAAAERRTHPLERILRIEEHEAETSVLFTTEHLLARVGKALRDAFGGKLRLRFGPEREQATATLRRAR